MRILDRERYRDFAKAYLICFTSLVGLYIVLDAFANLDEHAEVADGTLDLLGRMGRFYLVRVSKFYDDLCGVITMMAAIFTVTWLQKNNELIAMLAAGLSTQRVIRPVIVSAIVVSGLGMLNQEFIIPDIADELQRPPDVSAGTKITKLFHRFDLNGIGLRGDSAYADTKTVEKFDATLPSQQFGELLTLEAAEARYIPPEDARWPLHGGWLVRGAKISPAKAEWKSPLLVPIKPEELEAYPKPRLRPHEVAGDAFFLHSDVSFKEITRNRQWYYYASTVDIIRAMTKPISKTDRIEYAVFLHSRILRPLSAVTLLMLSLPLVLGGAQRNMFINLGLSLATSAGFYATSFLVQYLGRNGVLEPELTAWSPLIAFGTLAVSRWGRIRT